MTFSFVFAKDSINDTNDASMAGASESQDENKKTSTQDASNVRVKQVMVNQVKSSP